METNSAAQGFLWGNLAQNAPDEGLMEAKHCTILCRLP
jgi:hypothetical protein